MDKPIVDTMTLRRDLYFVMSLLLTDEKIAEIPDATTWKKDFYENEVSKQLLWAAAALRNLLDSLDEKKAEAFNIQFCGEYSDNFLNPNDQPLKFRQACNAIIHAEEILPYKGSKKESTESTNQIHTYNDRITVRGKHRGKATHAQADIIQFVQIAYALINQIEEEVMPTDRDTYKYHFKIGNKIVHTGITNDIDRRGAEHQSKRGQSKGHIKQVGVRTTRIAALVWEREQAKAGKPVRKDT